MMRRCFLLLVLFSVTTCGLGANDCADQGKCVNLCKYIEASCVPNSHCVMFNKRAACICKPGYVGDGSVHCRQLNHHKECGENDVACKAEEEKKLCGYVSCGVNAHCAAYKGKAACICNPRHTGDPAKKCDKIPGCDENEHCEPNHVCENNECQYYEPYVDHCRNKCGNNTDCNYYRGEAICSCREDHATGDPYRHGCRPLPGNCVDDKDMWDKTNPDCEKQFFFNPRKVRWHEAHRNCIADGMKLATIITLEEQTALENSTIDNSLKEDRYDWWLGAASLYGDKDYRWVTAGFDQVIHTNWAVGQPSPMTANDCVVLMGKDLRWHNKDCKKMYGYVCEYFGRKTKESVAS